jgi:hypothetical protein
LRSLEIKKKKKKTKGREIDWTFFSSRAQIHGRKKIKIKKKRLKR